MAHNDRCANAAMRRCVCSGCGGSQHGWTAYIGVAHDGPGRQELDEMAEQLSDRAEQAWRDATRPGRRAGPTLPKKRAAVRGACAGIVSWLASQIAEPGSAGPVGSGVDKTAETIGHLLVSVADELDGDRAQRLALADHFFCGLLAELAHAIDRVGDALDKAIEEVVSAVMEQRAADNRSFLDRLIVQLAVRLIVAGLNKIISRLALVGHIDDLQRAVRILAILMCPAPERHEAVVQYCLNPLGQPIITAIIRKRLEACMPDWMMGGPVEEAA